MSLKSARLSSLRDKLEEQGAGVELVVEEKVEKKGRTLIEKKKK